MEHIPDVIDARGQWWTIQLDAPLKGMERLARAVDPSREPWQFCDLAADVVAQYVEVMKRAGRKLAGTCQLTDKFDVKGSVFGADMALYTGTRRLIELASRTAIRVGMLLKKGYADREAVEQLMALLSHLYWLDMRGENIEVILKAAQKEVDSEA